MVLMIKRNLKDQIKRKETSIRCQSCNAQWTSGCSMYDVL